MKPEKRPPVKIGSTIGRMLKMLYGFYPVLLPAIIVCILFSAAVGAIPSLFMQKIMATILDFVYSRDWATAARTIIPLVAVLAVLYVLSLISVFAWNRMMAVMTQGTLKKLRCRMFDGMQDLPIRYFDTNHHGDSPCPTF